MPQRNLIIIIFEKPKLFLTIIFFKSLRVFNINTLLKKKQIIRFIYKHNLIKFENQKYMIQRNNIEIHFINAEKKFILTFIQIGLTSLDTIHSDLYFTVLTIVIFEYEFKN